MGSLQSIASKLREPEHATPPIVEDVKDKIKGQKALDGAQQKKSSSEPNEQQEQLTDKIMSEGLEKLSRRPEGKQTDLTSGTPTQVRTAPTLSCLATQLPMLSLDCTSLQACADSVSLFIVRCYHIVLSLVSCSAMCITCTTALYFKAEASISLYMATTSSCKNLAAYSSLRNHLRPLLHLLLMSSSPR